MNRKGILIAVVAVIIVLSIIWNSFRSRKVEKYRDEFVSAGLLSSSLDNFGVHSGAGDQWYLTVGGKTYYNVRGAVPLYLGIPALTSILFVTRDGKSGNKIHLVNTVTKAETLFEVGDLNFGNNIGAGRKPGDEWTDYVENVQADRIILTTRASGEKRLRITLNLISGKIEDGGWSDNLGGKK